MENSVKTVLVTGANGHLGHALIPVLKQKGYRILTLDLKELTADLKPHVDEAVTDTILNLDAVSALLEKQVEAIYHLAGTLAVTSELDPQKAHETNASGTVTIFNAALQYSEKTATPLQVILPSSIAVYGIPDVVTKNQAIITEDEYVNPQTIYGITKLYCEQLGIYYSDHYKSLSKNKKWSMDFRAVRLPGIIAQASSGDDIGKYAGLTMIHSPAEGGGYEVYVKSDTVLPFIAQEDAVNALIGLSEAPREKLQRRVYNVSGLAASVTDLTTAITQSFPEAAMSENLEEGRQKIVDTWPQAIDDSKARQDWGWNPKFDTLQKLLTPNK